jgi:hypothetical protein
MSFHCSSSEYGLVTRGCSVVRRTFISKLNSTSPRSTARDGRRVPGPGRAGERDVALAGEQPGRGVEPDPARARQVDLGPGVQVGEVVVGAGRPVERHLTSGFSWIR